MAGTNNAPQFWMQTTDPALVPAVQAGMQTNTAPTVPNTGDIWFDLTNTILYVWNGTAWSPYSDSVHKRVTTQIDATTTTFAAVAPFTFNLQAGKAYKFEFTFITTCDGTGGYKYDLNGGTATATSVNYNQTTTVAAAVVSADGTALNTSTGAAAAAVLTKIVGTIVCNAAGTFIPRFAQTAANATSSILINSHAVVTLVP